MAKLREWFTRKPKTQGGPQIQPEPTGDESTAPDELLDRISEIRFSAREQRRDWRPIGADGVNYVFGNQLADVKMKEGEVPVEDNQIFPAVTQEQALAAQNQVGVRTLPFEKSDEASAKVWEPLLQWLYESGLKVPEKITAGIIDGKTHGHWVGRLEWAPRARWDRKAQKWVGEVVLRLRKPDLVQFAKDTEDPDYPPWVVEFDRMRLEDAKAEFPDFADQLDEHVGGEEDQDGITQDTDALGLMYENQPGIGTEKDIRGRLARLLAGRATANTESQEKFIWVERHFFKDGATKKQEVPDGEFSDQELLDGGKVVYGADGTTLTNRDGEPIGDENRPRPTRKEDVPLYPSYRHVIITTSGDLKLKDEAWAFDEPPYPIGVNMPLPHTWHGLNGVEMARGLQDVQNRIASNMESWIALACVPITTVEEGTCPQCPDNNGISEEYVVKSGAFWRVAANRSAGVKFMDTPDMPATVPAVRDALMKSLRDQTGVQEVALGHQATGGATLGEIARLETSSKMRTAFQWKMTVTWILRVMRRAQAMCQEYWKPDDMRRIVGEGSEAAIVRLTAEQFDARFDLRLEVGSSLPFSVEQRKQEALTLYQLLGVPFLEALLDAFERDDKAEILSKVESWQMLLAAQERLAAEQSNLQETADGEQARQTQDVQPGRQSNSAGPAGPAPGAPVGAVAGA
jgi:hypothetical protein